MCVVACALIGVYILPQGRKYEPNKLEKYADNVITAVSVCVRLVHGKFKF